MSVYHRVTHDELSDCLRSLLWQTRQPEQIVIVIDGPIPEILEVALEQFQQQSTAPVELVRQEQNAGLTAALNAGLNHCSGEWILRMDADDLSLPTRFEEQLGWIESHPEIDVLGTAVYEFLRDPNKPERLKATKTEHEAISSSLGFRNPINHPTVCIRKQKLIDAQGYLDLPLLEDYFLWARLLERGARFQNLAKPLYLFRFDDATLGRRNGMQNFKNEVWLRKWMYDKKLISLPSLLLAIMAQLALRFSPIPLQRWLWKKSRLSESFELELPG